MGSTRWRATWEEPFLYPPNDLPCTHVHMCMHMSILLQAVCTGEGPAGEQLSMDEDDADTVAIASAVVDFCSRAAALARGSASGFRLAGLDARAARALL